MQHTGPIDVTDLAMPQMHPLIPPGQFDLATLLDHEPPTRWRPEPGEEIQGTVVKIETRRAFGTSSPVLFIMVDDRYWSIRCSGVVLKSWLDREKPREGDLVAFRYLGMVASPSTGREYAGYHGAIRRARRAA